MDKETLSNYGWIVIAVLVLVVMIALATPFGSFVSEAVQSTTKGLFDVNKSALDSTGLINIDNQEFDVPDMNHGAGENGGAGETPVVPGEPETTTVDHNGTTIPDGATYTKANGTVLNAGNAFPETVSLGDVYKFGDYEYHYNQYYIGATWKNASTQNGWGVLVTDTTKSAYGAIIESINNKPIKSLGCTFKGCTNLVESPTIPDSVTAMPGTFNDCSSLKTAPVIPNGVADLSNTFCDCTSLTSAPTIPYGVTNMLCTFYKCSALKNAPVIPNSVIDMYCTFAYCYSLTSAPEIPASVTNMGFVFRDCTSLTGTITINANPTTYNCCFYGVDFDAQPIILNGSSTMIDTLGTTGTNYCAECNGKCQGNH